MKRIKYLVWTMPAGMLAVLGGICIIFQSCNIPIEITPKGRFVNIENLYTPFIACGLILLIGTGFSIFNFVQLAKISRILKERGYSI